MSEDKTHNFFVRWKKAELLDLLSKFRVTDIPNHAKKSDLIETVLNHLDSLATPLDCEIDYPELKEYFESYGGNRDEPHEEGSEGSEGSEASEDSESSASGEEEQSLDTKKNYNLLSFKSCEDCKEMFKFNFQDQFCDIIQSTKKFNEDVQDFLSAISTISVIFTLIEFYFVTFNIVSNQETLFTWENLITLCVWFTFYVAIPSLFGYYFNFVRYALEIELDPMTFNIVKALISLAILNCKIIPNYELALFSNVYPCKQVLLNHLHIVRDAVGQLPLVFAVAGCLITLYVL